MNKKGFTLIEILITMALMAIILSAVFVSKEGIEDSFSLQRAVYKLSQDFRTVAEMAMGAGEGNCGAMNVCGYGIYFLNDRYSSFVDCAVDCSTSNHERDVIPDPINDVDIVQILLEQGVQIISTSPPSPVLSVLFSPPDPVVYINGAEWGQEAIITFGIGSETKQVRINSAGRVEIE